MTVDKDKPTIHATLKALDTEGKPEPFVYGTKTGKRVTFPDLFDMDWEEGERFLLDMQTESNGEVLSKWLPKEDYENLQAEKLSLRQLGILLNTVMEHYEGSIGTSGKERASKS